MHKKHTTVAVEAITNRPQLQGDAKKIIILAVKNKRKQQKYKYKNIKEEEKCKKQK